MGMAAEWVYLPHLWGAHHPLGANRMSKPKGKMPAALNRFTDRVLAYRPAPKRKPKPKPSPAASGESSR